MSKTLTLSPGIRYEAQTHVTDYNGFAPRFGVTWSPFKSGKTTIRGSGGIFYDWLGVGTYAQTHPRRRLPPARPDDHQSDVSGSGQRREHHGDQQVPAGSDYVHAAQPRRERRRGSDDHAAHPRSAAGTRSRAGTKVARGNNLNAPVNGVRPIRCSSTSSRPVSDGAYRSHEVYVSSSFSLVSGPAAQQPRFNWKRLSFNGNYSTTATATTPKARSPCRPAARSRPSGARTGRGTHFVSFGVNSGVVKNMNINVGFNTVERRLLQRHDRPRQQRRPLVQRSAGRRRRATARRCRSGTWACEWASATRSPSARARRRAPPGHHDQRRRSRRRSPCHDRGAERAPGGTAMSINVNANNITNRNNYGGYGGNMSNIQGFGRPTSLRRAAADQRLDVLRVLRVG